MLHISRGGGGGGGGLEYLAECSPSGSYTSGDYTQSLNTVSVHSASVWYGQLSKLAGQGSHRMQ